MKYTRRNLLKRGKHYRGVWREANLNSLETYKRVLKRILQVEAYGISMAEYFALIKKQKKRCAICGVVTQLVIDHCHNQRHVRGLLCSPCNLGLGQFKDSIRLMKKAINYLSRKKG